VLRGHISIEAIGTCCSGIWQ